MKHWILFLILSVWLIACSPKLVYEPAPPQVLNTQRVVEIVGSVSPWGLDFMAVAATQDTGIRLLVLSAFGMKLLDAMVENDRAVIYFKQEKFPPVAVQAFIRFTRATFVNSCMDEKISYKDARTQAVFEARPIGGNKCL